MRFISFKKFIIISRPILFPLIFLCLICALFFSTSSLVLINLIDLIFILFLTFLIPFFTFSINDLYDYNSDKINIRKKSILYGKFISNIKQYSFSIYLYNFMIFLFLFIFAFIFYNIQTMLIIIILFFLIYFYSAKPLRFKEVYLLDSLSNGLIALFTFLLIYSFYNDIFALPLEVYLIALSISSYHLIAAQLDVVSDKSSNHKTTATKINNKDVVYLICILFNLPLLFFKINSGFKYLFYVNIFIIFILYFFPRVKKIYLFLFFIISWMFITMSYILNYLF